MDLQKEINDFKKEITENRDSLLTTLNYILAFDFIVKNRLPVTHEWKNVCDALELIWDCSDKLIYCLNSLIAPIEPLRDCGRIIEALYRVTLIKSEEKVTMAMTERMRDGVEGLYYQFNNFVGPKIDSWGRQVFENQKAELHY
jgi:hypothetical protein